MGWERELEYREKTPSVPEWALENTSCLKPENSNPDWDLNLHSSTGGRESTLANIYTSISSITFTDRKVSGRIMCLTFSITSQLEMVLPGVFSCGSWAQMLILATGFRYRPWGSYSSTASDVSLHTDVFAMLQVDTCMDSYTPVVKTKIDVCIHIIYINNNIHNTCTFQKFLFKCKVWIHIIKVCNVFTYCKPPNKIVTFLLTWPNYTKASLNWHD